MYMANDSSHYSDFVELGINSVIVKKHLQKNVEVARQLGMEIYYRVLNGDIATGNTERVDKFLLELGGNGIFIDEPLIKVKRDDYKLSDAKWLARHVRYLNKPIMITSPTFKALREFKYLSVGWAPDFYPVRPLMNHYWWQKRLIRKALKYHNTIEPVVQTHPRWEYLEQRNPDWLSKLVSTLPSQAGLYERPKVKQVRKQIKVCSQKGVKRIWFFPGDRPDHPLDAWTPERKEYFKKILAR